MTTHVCDAPRSSDHRAFTFHRRRRHRRACWFSWLLIHFACARSPAVRGERTAACVRADGILFARPPPPRSPLARPSIRLCATFLPVRSLDLANSRRWHTRLLHHPGSDFRRRCVCLLSFRASLQFFHKAQRPFPAQTS
jgi:hypothetical protein